MGGDCSLESPRGRTVGNRRMPNSEKPNPALTRRLILPLTAAFALLWAIARASIQAITIDEADTYNLFVARWQPWHWDAASNNHILNSALMRLFTSVFPLTELTVRIPALIGAAIYIVAAYALCRVIGRSLALRWALLVCLVYNPFVFDYLVAARGYGMALGFLLSALAVAAYGQQVGPAGPRLDPVRICAFASALSGLSVAANFSFAFVTAVALVLIFTWTALRARGGYARLIAATVLPGFVVSVFLSLPAAWKMPVSQLWYGAKALTQTFHSIIAASFYELNPSTVNPMLFPVFNRAKDFLLAALCMVCLWRLAAIALDRSHPRQNAWLLGFGGLSAGTFLITTGLHRLSYTLLRLPMPLERTGLFFVLLFLLAVGAVAAVRVDTPAGRYSYRAVTGVLLTLACYFVFCLRLSYFMEWKYDADTGRVYSVLAYYNRQYGVRDIASEWRYVAALNFYRERTGSATIRPFVSLPLDSASLYPADKQVYVLYLPQAGAFIQQQGLKVVYRGALSDVVVAIRPEIERPVNNNF